MFNFVVFFTLCVFSQTFVSPCGDGLFPPIPWDQGRTNVFWRTLATSFDLRGVINGNRMAGIPLGMTLGSGELDVEGVCTRSGMACQNCTISVTCVPLPVGWLKVFLEECQEGYTCNAHVGSCTAASVPECTTSAQEFEHTCEQVGIFPDAYDCRKFHLCSPPEGLPDGRPADHRVAMCPGHYGYNPQTAQCSIQLKNGQCSEKPVPECKTVGQNGVLALSANHYYVCLMKNQELYPQIFICPHGWYFWGGFCQPEPEVKNTNGQTDGANKGRTLDESSSISDENKGNDEGSNINVVNTSNTSEENKGDDEETNKNVVQATDAETTTQRTSTYKIDSFFSTEKPPTYAADTFLADKFDLSNYETTDDVQPPSQGDFINSFEDGNMFGTFNDYF